MSVIEIAGSGSPYAFAGDSEAPEDLDWRCLFPGRRMEDVPLGAACREVQRVLDMIDPDVVFCGALAFPSGAGSLEPFLAPLRLPRA